MLPGLVYQIYFKEYFEKYAACWERVWNVYFLPPHSIVFSQSCSSNINRQHGFIKFDIETLLWLIWTNKRTWHKHGGMWDVIEMAAKHRVCFTERWYWGKRKRNKHRELYAMWSSRCKPISLCYRFFLRCLVHSVMNRNRIIWHLSDVASHPNLTKVSM